MYNVVVYSDIEHNLTHVKEANIAISLNYVDRYFRIKIITCAK